ncbi:hypothetical protein [uncultured Clostridium sp.]|uniref:hypothetical protein n=1 Tax=uncultured Clostridium sp. TaxID=59620 RepID=UPI0025E2E064|nr:hypothetical protein [uncultured Clostridium sp.]
MVKRSDRSKQKKTKYSDIHKSSLILNILLCIISLMIILYDTAKYNDINLYLVFALIICIMLSNIILYTIRISENFHNDNINSSIARKKINNSAFDLNKSRDYMTGLYNGTFLENLLKKIEDEKFIPTSICIFYIYGLCQIMSTEQKKEVIQKTAQIVLSNKHENSIACISENNNIVLIMINNSRSDLNYIAERVGSEFSEIYGKHNFKLIYSIEEMDSREEVIYDVFGRAADNINSFVHKI